MANENIIYFDTSALNLLFKHVNTDGAQKYFQLWQRNGLTIRPSPTLFIEILLTSDPDIRESLIFFAQHLFQAPCLPSPEELIISYIEQGCPLEETQRALPPGQGIGEVWEKLRKEKERTFVFEHSELKERMKLHYRLTECLKRLIDNSTQVEDDLEETVHFSCKTFEQLIQQADPVLWTEMGDLASYTVFYATTILCMELSPEPISIAGFWTKHKVDHTIERFKYLVQHNPEIFYRGPIVTMAMMTKLQFQGRHTRGLWMDCLHSIYLPYCRLMFSSDPHFKDLKDSNPLFEKIRIASDALVK